MFVTDWFLKHDKLDSLLANKLHAMMTILCFFFFILPLDILQNLNAEFTNYGLLDKIYIGPTQ